MGKQTEIKTLIQSTYCEQAYSLGYPQAASLGSPSGASHNEELSEQAPTCGAVE